MIVYRLQHRQSGKSYVGITRGELTCRVWKHLHATSLIGRALKKYGLVNFSIKIIDRATTWRELCWKEKLWILLSTSRHPHGYNLTDGGDGVRDSTGEIRRKISSIAKEKHFGDRLVIHGTNTRWKKGQTAWNKGKSMSDRWRHNLSRSHMGKVQSDETKEKRRRKLLGHPNWNPNMPRDPATGRLVSRQK